MSGFCSRCLGGKKLVAGALLLLNAFVWPQWLGVDGWVTFVALLMVIGGVLKLVWPSCGHCKEGCCMPTMPAKTAVAKPAKKSSSKKRKR